MKIPFYILFAASIISSGARAADVHFIGVNGELLVNIERHVRLVKRLRNIDAQPPREGELRRLESRVESEVQQALEPFGYYQAQVQLDARELPQTYRYLVSLNQRVTVTSLSLRLSTEAQKQAEFLDWLESFPLQSGMPLDQISYSAKKGELLSSAVRLGYFDAKYRKSEIAINEQRTGAKVILDFDSGKRYTIGDVNIEWNLDSISDEKNKRGIEGEILNSLLEINNGEPYTASALAKTQRTLLTTPYFSSVDIRAGERDTETATVPILITLTPSKRKAYNFAVGAGTDTGIRGSIGYENRRINRRGHNLNARVGGSEIERTAIVNYSIPLARSAKDSLNFFASLDEEFGDTRRFQSAQVGSEWVRQWQESLIRFGLTASREKFIRRSDDFSEVERSTDLLIPSFGWERTKGDDLYFPTKGWSASTNFRVASSSLGSDIDLAQAIFSGKILRPLGDGRLKLRLKLAGSLVDEALELPESLGFLAGGDDSIRGYAFESIGVVRNGELSVAKNLAVGSVEYEHPIKNGFALAAFVDAGDAFDSNPSYKTGAGLGLRWRLPFGALRLDAASALDRDGKPIRLHFSFGTDL